LCLTNGDSGDLVLLETLDQDAERDRHDGRERREDREPVDAGEERAHAGAARAEMDLGRGCPPAFVESLGGIDLGEEIKSRHRGPPVVIVDESIDY
jgi:hypothetical protein